MCFYGCGFCIVNPVEKQNKTKQGPHIFILWRKTHFHGWEGFPKYKASRVIFQYNSKKRNQWDKNIKHPDIISIKILMGNIIVNKKCMFAINEKIPLPTG